jgi:hypothetical protein
MHAYACICFSLTAATQPSIALLLVLLLLLQAGCCNSR